MTSTQVVNAKAWRVKMSHKKPVLEGHQSLKRTLRTRNNLNRLESQFARTNSWFLTRYLQERKVASFLVKHRVALIII